MFNRIQKSENSYGSSTVEYIFLVTVVLLTLLIFGGYFMRGVFGRWKSVGDGFGYGMRYSAAKTLECEFDQYYTMNWYNLTCYEENCDCESKRATINSCAQCINTCRTPMCE